MPKEQGEDWIAIARTGTFQDSEGRNQTFNAADLDAIAANYDPARLEAPLVFGHLLQTAPDASAAHAGHFGVEGRGSDRARGPARRRAPGPG